MISTPVNYTCTNLANHLEGTSHDTVNDYLRREKHTARPIWELAEPLINDRIVVRSIAVDKIDNSNSFHKTMRISTILAFHPLHHSRMTFILHAVIRYQITTRPIIDQRLGRGLTSRFTRGP